ncbi:hypothetical protein PCH_Pc16g02900 [Penicillium rubens Wisconsin 54-1255]|uniref:Uncharacterized protein n=1 Tax=Penicillium rubens (strain ATCC 28089 / DSM 1075 / NRRL 1951 / Wisconsin 54-1255) TaxID=500485 RepID=B6H7K4_PENRW|nr:hypothetical protein PCH_Pc16g02900 [Penicillium rubens Wisconsin 54-1255]
MEDAKEVVAKHRWNGYKRLKRAVRKFLGNNIDRRQLQEATDQIDASETKFPTVAITTLSVFADVFFGLFLTHPFSPSASPPHNEESMALEVLHLADKRGPILALEVGGVVFLVLVLMRTLSLVYWYIRLKILLKLDPDGRYDNDTRWTVIDTLTDMEASQDPMKASLPYSLDDEGLYFHPSDAEPSLCLPKSMTKKVFALVHDDQGHCI